MIREKSAPVLNGVVTFVVLTVLSIAESWILVRSIQAENAPGIVSAVVALLVTAISYAGIVVVSPNEAEVIQLFGNYLGTIRVPGFWWTNPLAFPRHKVSLRIRNFESSKLKVNDRDGNPIEIAAIVVWRVVDTAEAIFQVNDYENFLKVQSEAAVRSLATSYPYDAHDADLALRTASPEILERLRREIQERLAQAGIEVIEARLSHLAYAPEIAQAMLRRQQAGAVVAARTRIVEGAVGMVEMALEELSKKGVVQLDEERKAAMVSNLMVVLVSDRDTQPIVNTGTLYQ